MYLYTRNYKFKEFIILIVFQGFMGIHPAKEQKKPTQLLNKYIQKPKNSEQYTQSISNDFEKSLIDSRHLHEDIVLLLNTIFDACFIAIFMSFDTGLRNDLGMLGRRLRFSVARGRRLKLTRYKFQHLTEANDELTTVFDI